MINPHSADYAITNPPYELRVDGIIMNSAVSDWFGDEFLLLDPLLQELHKQGGTLSGMVDLEYGSGLAGFIGRWLASKLGLPTLLGKVDFEVNISHAVRRSG